MGIVKLTSFFIFFFFFFYDEERNEILSISKEMERNWLVQYRRAK
jgi:hypothetical protein